MKWVVDRNDGEPGISISMIEFNDGNKIDEIGKNDIVVFVGPNNVGKSQTLKDIYNSLADEPISILKKIYPHKWGDVDKLKTLIRHVGNLVPESNQYIVMGKYIDYANIDYILRDPINGSSSIRDLFSCNLNTETRLSVCRPAEFITRNDSKTHPIHYLAFDSDIRKKFSKYFDMAFNKYVVPNTGYGKEIPLVILDNKIQPRTESFDDETERIEAYTNELMKYPMAHEQGDGVKSFIGILLYLILDFYKIYLIDEPEAFLHPPQAKIMGRMIAELTQGDKQVFISTHSEQLIHGLLDAAPDRVKIVRMTREKKKNSVFILNANTIERVWNDPILKYSNILQGLFFKNVVLCESDSDCRFYSIINDFLQKEKGNYADTFFTYSGGKQRIPVVMKALSSLGVDTKVIVDIDVIDTRKVFQEICAACQINWNLISRDYDNIYDGIKRHSDTKMKPKEEILAEINEITKQSSDAEYYSEDEVKQIKAMLKRNSPWKMLKLNGKEAIPDDLLRQSFNHIDGLTKENNLFIVPVGELESFVDVGKLHGPRWVDKVLEQYSDLNNQVYDNVKEFINLLQL